MRLNTRRGQRIATGAGVTAALTLAFAGVVSAPTSNAADPDQKSTFNSQAGSPAEFGGYVGYRGADGADGAAKAATHDKAKPADPTLGKPGGRHSSDVPGAASTSNSADQDRYTKLGQASTTPDDVAEIRRAIAAKGTARVNVNTKVPVALESKLSARGVSAQHRAIRTSLNALDSSLAGTGAKLVSRLQVQPTATYQVNRAGLDALLANDAVAAVSLDGMAQLSLDVSTGVIDSDLLNSAGVRGNNFEGSAGFYEVAILDSGVDNQHNAFAGKIVDQACFSAGSDCPNGLTSQIGGNAADNCTYTPVTRHCEHGTHVASIAAGSNYSGGHEGVADGARIIAIQMGSDGGGTWGAFFSDINLSLQRVLNLRNAGHRVVSVNMSIGIDGFAQNSNCDANNANFQATQNISAQLQAAGVAVIAAAGNSNLVGASYPACLSSVHSISATDDADNVAGFTNSGVTTDWWAPGVGIVAAIPPGPNTADSKSGTSMSAPHVAGAWALMRECVDGNGVPITNAAVVSRLNATGVNITDNGATRKRINVLDAATGTVNNNDFAVCGDASRHPAAGGFNDFDFTVCSDAEPGEPGPFSIDNGVWWNWTPAATGTATISTEDNGTNVTTFDTTLAVYTGNAINALTNVAFDDDAGTGNRSLVTFPVQGGTTYRVKVDGFAAANGLLNLHVENGPPPTCGGVAATLVGSINGEVINGTAGADVIVTGAGNDTVNAGQGNDRICGDAGDDTINAGGGDDFVLGGSGADTITGAVGNDTLVGNPGGGSNDDLGDTITGGPGNDFIDGWFGDDHLEGGLGNDQLRGEAGVDQVSYLNAPSGVTASLATGTSSGGAGIDSYVLVENILGSVHADSLTGDAGPNTIVAGMGPDIVDGGAGIDDLRGNIGNDLLRGRAGSDTINGNEGVDTVAYNLSPAAVTVNLTAGTATGEGNDTLVLLENVNGSGAGDTVTGNGGPNTLNGGNGPDTLSGLAGPDSVNGGPGNDTCQGGLGNDTQTSCETAVGFP